MECMRRERNNRILVLEQLIMDSTRFGFNEQESLSYIESRTGGKGIARSRYYAIKKKLSENQSSIYKDRMAYQTKLGIIINHFKRIEEIEYIQTTLLRTLHFETSKPKEEQSLFAISKIASNLVTNTRLLVEMNVSSPIVDQIRREIDKALNINVEDRGMRTEYGHVPPSALTMPKGFIEPSLYCQDENSEAPTRKGKRPTDAVF